MKNNKPTKRTRSELKQLYSAVSPRKSRVRSTQTTISLSSFELSDIPKSLDIKKLHVECEALAKRFTRAIPSLLDVKTKGRTLRMHVAQPQLAAELAKHFTRSYKKYHPQHTVVWSRDTVKKLVWAAVKFGEPQENRSSTKKSPASHKGGKELHRWSAWYAWQEEQQRKASS